MIPHRLFTHRHTCAGHTGCPLPRARTNTSCRFHHWLAICTWTSAGPTSTEVFKFRIYFSLPSNPGYEQPPFCFIYKRIYQKKHVFMVELLSPPLFPSITLSVTFLLILEPQFHILSKRYASTAVNRSSECDKSWPGGDRVIVEHTSA